MRIGDLARRTGKSVATLRFYEQQGLLPAPERTESGYRSYASEAVDRVGFIVQAQARGFSLEEIGTLLTLLDQGQAPCGRVAETARRKLGELEKLIAAMQERRRSLTLVLQRWESGEVGEGPFCPMLTTATSTRRTTEMARKVEVFTADCPLCEPVVATVQRLACPNCEVTVHHLSDTEAAARAREAGVERVPMVLVDGQPAECCRTGAVIEEGLRAAGVGA